MPTTINSTRYVVEHLGDYQVLVDPHSLEVCLIYKPVIDLHGQKINALKTASMMGLHMICKNRLTWANGVIICEKCDEVVELEELS